MNKYKPLSLAAILALIFTLSACSEQLLETVTEDPEPDITTGENSVSSEPGIAMFDTDAGLVPSPNDIVLSSISAASVEAGGSEVKTVSQLMPIRIPFSSSLPPLHDDNGNWNSTNGDKLADNLLITANFVTYINVKPQRDIANNVVDENGAFKIIYFDTNNDLVLVPDDSTFESNTTYVFFITNSLADADGNFITADTTTQLLMSASPLIEGTEDDFNITSYLLEGKYEDEDDGGYGTVSALEGVRQRYVVDSDLNSSTDIDGGLTNLLRTFRPLDNSVDIVQIFTMKTEEIEEEDESEEEGDSNDSNAMVKTASLTGTGDSDGNTSATEDNLLWLNSTFTAIEDTTANANTLVTLQAGEVIGIETNISAVYEGLYTCTNYLREQPVDLQGSTSWKIDLASRANAPVNDCPNNLVVGETETNGSIGFWLIKPANPEGVVVFLHGINGNKDYAFNLAEIFTGNNYAVIAPEIWGHGDRAYQDYDGDDKEYVDAEFIRPDNPELTVGYMIQTQMDLVRLMTLLIANEEMISAVGIDGGTPSENIHFIGMSLGGIIGVGLGIYDLLLSLESLGSGGPAFPPNKYILNVTGGDITDIVLNGHFGDEIRQSVLNSLIEDGEDVDSIYDNEVNAQITALDLLSSHGLFKSGTAEPLLIGSTTTTFPEQVLLQQMNGDTVVPNDNSALLGIDMNLTVKSDGDGSSELSRVLWELDPSKYSLLQGTEAAGHGFLIDFDTTATAQGQWQAVCFLKDGTILDPSKTININCTNSE